MNIWHDINGERIKKDNFVSVIEIQKNGRNKYELDKETGMLRLDRILYTATHYPANYGFIPRTYAGDGDPLDVLVICHEEIVPLTLVETYPIGVLKMIDGGEEDEKIIEWALKATGTWVLRDKSIQECSGGESQRVWIATVLAQQPEILFLDEPTTYLDIAHQQETMKLVKRLNHEAGIGVVMVLHDLSHALEISDRIIVLKNGCKYGEGRPQDIITPKMMREVYDVDCDIVQIPGRKKPLIMFKEIS